MDCTTMAVYFKGRKVEFPDFMINFISYNFINTDQM